MPFEIPESWVLSDFSELVTLLSGRDLESNDCNSNREGIPYLIGASNIVDSKINITRWTTKPLVISKRGDILISCKGTIGEVVTNVIGEIHIARQFMAIQTLPKVFAGYIELYIKSIVNNIKRNARGVIPGISREDILQREIALPPLEEQKRIVIEVEKWLDFIADIEAEKDELESHIKKTKSKILDLAISGKLVPQDPNDEPAIELLKRINPGFKPCDNSHYENMPQGWVKLRLGDVCSFERGITFPSSAKCTIKQPGMIACIRTANVQDNLELDDLWYVGNEYIKGNTEKLVRKNDIIMSSANSRELVGKVSYVHDLSEQMTFGGFVLNIRANECILPFFLFLMLRTLYLKGYYLTIATQTTNIANLNTKILGDIEVLLPPLTEQERIINSVTNILASIENITAELS